MKTKYPKPVQIDQYMHQTVTRQNEISKTKGKNKSNNT